MDFYKIIIGLLLVLILLLLGIFIVIIYHFFRKVNISKTEEPYIKRDKASIIQSGLCYIHNDTNSVGICSICDQDICETCLKQIDKVNLCPAHLKVYIQNRWVPITNQKTTPDTPEAGVYIYNFKKDLWKNKENPTFIMNDYKINIDEDFIETYVQLYVLEEEAETLKEEIDQLVYH